MIPKVRTWKVTFYYGDADKQKHNLTQNRIDWYVDTINKSFAKALATEALGYMRAYDAHKITVSLATRT